MVHIESKKSKKFESEYEIFVNLASDKNCLKTMPEVVKALRKQLSYVRIDDELLRSSSQSSTDDIFDTSNTVAINQTNGKVELGITRSMSGKGKLKKVFNMKLIIKE